MARQALQLGMVDRVETLDATLARLAGRRSSTRAGASADAEFVPDPVAHVADADDPQRTSAGDLNRRRRRLRALEQAV